MNKWYIGLYVKYLLISTIFLTVSCCGCKDSKKDPAYANVAEALRRKNLSAAKKLIKRGASLNERCEIGWTALHYAAFDKHDEFVAFLLKCDGIDIHVRNRAGQMPLHLARSKHGAQLLINAGADVNAKDFHGQTPLHWASMHNDVDILELLLKNGADLGAVDDKGQTSLNLATGLENVETARFLFQSGASINTLHTAVLLGDISTAKIFIKDGTSPDAKNERYGNTALHYAALTCSIEMALMLIEEGANVNSLNNHGSSPLDCAVGRNQENMVKFLLGRGADPSGGNTNTGLTTLHSAAESGYTSIAQLLITHGVDVNIRSKIAGETPLHRTSDQDMAKLLIADGADVNAKAKSGQTPLHMAAWQGDHEIVRLLVAAGANVNEKDDHGRTALHEVGLQGGKDTAELLIGSGADVNTRADNGRTPLHEAAYSGQVGVIEVLIAKGAAVNIRDSSLETPLDIAIKHKKKEIIKLLRKYGAK